MRWKALLVAVVLLAVAAGAGWPVYVHPRTDAVSAADPADAVLALGGLGLTAVYAERLQQEGVVRDVVVSDPYRSGTAPQVTRLCGLPRVTCFVPKPSTTRGEAREFGRLARANGWDDVLVAAPTWHISRARLIVDRCYSGRLRMVDPGIQANRWDWPLLYAYQTAGFAKAAVLRGC